MKCVCVCALMYQLHLKLCVREKKTGDVQLKCTFHSRAVCYFSPAARLVHTHASLTTLSYLFICLLVLARVVLDCCFSS